MHIYRGISLNIAKIHDADFCRDDELDSEPHLDLTVGKVSSSALAIRCADRWMHCECEGHTQKVKLKLRTIKRDGFSETFPLYWISVI